MIEALRCMIAKSPVAGSMALQALMNLNQGDALTDATYAKLVEAAFGDPEATFTEDDRVMIASYLNNSPAYITKTAILRVRITLAEQAQLRARAGKQGISAYVRGTLFGTKQG
jgi:hypothetical protein